jgi:hypothetical protein
MDVGPGQTDVFEEVIVKLHEVFLASARLNRPLAGPQDLRKGAGKEEDCNGYRRADEIRLRVVEVQEVAVTRRLECLVVQIGSNGMQVRHRGCSRVASHPR